MSIDTKAEVQKIWDLFDPLWSDLAEDNYLQHKPLLAHYTSVSNLEKILTSGEIWFSNPLYMNDHEEVRFGVLKGMEVVGESKELKDALATQSASDAFGRALTHFFDQFANDQVLDTYVFSMSQHDAQDQDGLLSMWRGYGGNGSGVAMVIDTSKMTARLDSPLILSRVHYGTADQRIDWIQRKVKEFAALLSQLRLPDDALWVAASVLFERIKLFALFSKHRGFWEEREWRAVYIPARDPERKLAHFYGYSIGARGLEPKLKFRLAPLNGVTADDFSLGKILDRILLGPTIASPLAKAAVLRMLDVTKHAELKDRVSASGIPFRDRF